MILTPRCDFCDSPLVVTRYDCRDFDSSSIAAGIIPVGPGSIEAVLASKNFWAACAECAKFVEAEDLTGLAKYAESQFDISRMSASQLVMFRVHLRGTYKLFFENRIRVSGR
jgi:hypothetical protein